MNRLRFLLHAPGARPWWWALQLGLMLPVCFLAFSPAAPGLQFENVDKWQHLGAFAALTACCALALAPGRAGMLKAGLAMLAFGVFIELVQVHIPSRSAEWQDVLADALGIVLGLGLVAGARRCWPAGPAGQDGLPARPGAARGRPAGS